VFATRSPRGSTPLAGALAECLKLAGKSDKKDFVIVFTDGVPDDKAAAANVIVNAANAQETEDALTFLFVQVGDDAAATNYLQSLDDDLTNAKFDIVDAKTMAEAEAFATTADMIIAAIND
jgi:Mg-chelatase subunit ChlD